MQVTVISENFAKMNLYQLLHARDVLRTKDTSPFGDSFPLLDAGITATIREMTHKDRAELFSVGLRLRTTAPQSWELANA